MKMDSLRLNSSSYDEGPGKEISRSMNNDNYSVYVTGIPPDLTPGALKSLFGYCGEVKKATTHSSRKGYQTNFGFVEFAKKQEAFKALEMFKEYKLGNHVLKACVYEKRLNNSSSRSDSLNKIDPAEFVNKSIEISSKRAEDRFKKFQSASKGKSVSEKKFSPCASCGKLCHAACMSCKSVRYCGSSCQRDDWQRHKAECAALSSTVAESNGDIKTISSQLEESLSVQIGDGLMESMKDQLESVGKCSSSDSIASTKNMGRSKIPLPVSPEQSIQAQLLDFQPGGILYCTLLSGVEATLEKICHLDEYYSQGNGVAPIIVKQGCFYAAPFSSDGKWYRAFVQAINEDDMTCNVWYVDFGNCEFVSTKNLMALAKEFSSVPCCTVRCTLDGCDHISDMEIKEFFMGMLTDNVVEIYVNSIEDNMAKVVMFGTIDGTRGQINKCLLDKYGSKSVKNAEETARSINSLPCLTSEDTCKLTSTTGRPVQSDHNVADPKENVKQVMTCDGKTAGSLSTSGYSLESDIDAARSRCNDNSAAACPSRSCDMQPDSCLSRSSSFASIRHPEKDSNIDINGFPTCSNHQVDHSAADVFQSGGGHTVLLPNSKRQMSSDRVQRHREPDLDSNVSDTSSSIRNGPSSHTKLGSIFNKLKNKSYTSEPQLKLPAVKVPKGKVEAVITKVNSIEEMYVTLVSESKKLLQLQEDLNKFCDMNFAKQVYRKGMVCASKSSAKPGWHRVKIISQESDSQVKLFFLDFGHKEVVDPSTLCKILNEKRFWDLCQQAIPCKLKNCRNGSLNYNAECMDALLQCEQLTVVAEIDDVKENNRYPITVFIEDSSDTINSYISDLYDDFPAEKQETHSPEEIVCSQQPSESERVKVTTPTPMQSIVAVEQNNLVLEKRNTSNDALPFLVNLKTAAEDVVANQPLEILVTNVVDPGHFTFQIFGPKLVALGKLSAAMTEFYADLQTGGLNSVQKGGVYAVKYSLDSMWYRAEVLEGAEDDGTYKVLFLDYGNKEQVHGKDVKPLREEFSSLPVQGIQGRLYRCCPVVDSKWSEESIAGVQALLDKKFPAMVHGFDKNGRGVVDIEVTLDGLSLTDVLAEQRYVKLATKNEIVALELKKAVPSSSSNSSEFQRSVTVTSTTKQMSQDRVLEHSDLYNEGSPDERNQMIEMPQFQKNCPVAIQIKKVVLPHLVLACAAGSNGQMMLFNCKIALLKHIIADEEYCKSISSFAGKFVDAVFIKEEKDRSGLVFVMFIPEVVNHVVSAGLAKVCFEGLF